MLIRSHNVFVFNQNHQVSILLALIQPRLKQRFPVIDCHMLINYIINGDSNNNKKVHNSYLQQTSQL